MWLLTGFILLLHGKSCKLTSLIYTSRSVTFLSHQSMDYTVYTRSQSEPASKYNTSSDCLSAYTEWSPQGFQMRCSIVWYLYDSVISNECKSFEARFEYPRSLHNSQLIWLETPYGHAGYQWE